MYKIINKLNPMFALLICFISFSAFAEQEKDCEFNKPCDLKAVGSGVQRAWFPYTENQGYQCAITKLASAPVSSTELTFYFDIMYTKYTEATFLIIPPQKISLIDSSIQNSLTVHIPTEKMEGRLGIQVLGLDGNTTVSILCSK